MADSIGLFIYLGSFLILITIGFFVGGQSERNHLRKLADRERQMADILVTQLKSFPEAVSGPSPPCMLVGETVIATDYLKSFLAKIRNIFGGEIRSYQSLLTRARRESLLRILEQARRQGYNAVCNVRYETADVGGNSTMRRVAMAAIIASATAYHCRQSPT